MARIVASTLPLACFLVLCIVHYAQGACNAGNPSGSGILQLVDTSSDCRPSSFADRNDLFALCGQSFKATIDKKGLMLLTPSSTASYNFSGPGPFNSGNFPCNLLNATGTAAGKAPKAASVSFYGDVNLSPPSSLKVLSGGFINLTIAGYFTYQSGPLQCWLKYKVTSGCVLGVKAPAKPYVCPSGTFIKKGKFGNYCSMCPAGTFSTKPNSKSCTPCKAGFNNPFYGKAKCTKCPPGSYASKAGTANCDLCSSDDTNQLYTNGVFCKKCPADSWQSSTIPSQCVACADGNKCCRVGAGPGCPACPKGFKSGKNATAVLAFVGASPAKCAGNDAPQCSTTVKITVDKKCKIYTDSSSPLDVFTANTICSNSNPGLFGETIKGAKPQLSDIIAFFSYQGGAQPATLKGGFLTLPQKTDPGTFGVKVPGTCRYTYRILSVSSPNPFPFSPTPCTAGSPGCVSKAKPPTCGPGQYVRGTACLPCPPGQHKAGKSSATKCLLCPPGTLSIGYGNTKCNKCPPGTSTNGGAGRSACLSCDAGTYSPAGQGFCSACPAGTNGVPPLEPSMCMGNNLGTICCGAGSCKGKVPDCPSGLTSDDDTTYTAVIKLVKKQAPLPACKDSTFITCQAIGAYSKMASRDTAKLGYDVTPIGQPKCLEFGSALFSYIFSIGPNRANSLLDPVYDVQAFPSNKSIIFIDTAAKGKCWAEFKLVAGYAFSITPPAKPDCPSNAVTQAIDTRKFCTFCDAGSYSDGKACQPCPKDTFSAFTGATSCKKCPAGQFTFGPNNSLCSSCGRGGAKVPGKDDCIQCPANTFSKDGSTTKCTPCPKGFFSNPGAGSCTRNFPQ